MTVELHGNVDPSGRRVVEALIDNQICRSAWYAGQCDSTNSQAMSDLRDQVVDHDALPRLYLTDSQTAGRGRHGRVWLAGETNLAFSLVVRAETGSSGSVLPEALKMLPLAAGVAIAQTIEHDFAPLRVSLKWPNDVWVDNAKVAGILLERPTGDTIVIGIGLNVGEAPPIASPTTCLRRVTGREMDRFAVLHSLIERLADITEAFFDPESTTTMQRTLEYFRSRCVLAGRSISFSFQGQTLAGHCEGVDEQGRLKVHTASRIHLLESGEANLIRPG